MISFHPMSPNGAVSPGLYARGYIHLIRDAVADVAFVMRRKVWSPCVWRDGERREANFSLADWCVLDFDDPVVTLDEALNLFCDRVHVIGTTKSHRKEKNGVVCDRFRVAIPFERRIDETYAFKWNMRQVVEKYSADPQCIDAARFYWPCNEIVSIEAEGYRQDVRDAPPAPPPDTEALERIRTSPISRATRRLMDVGADAGKRNHQCFLAALELYRKGYSEGQIATAIYAKVPTSDDFTEQEKKTILRSAKYHCDKPPPKRETADATR